MTQSPVLILGARSDIGIAIAQGFAELGHPLQLAARSAASLNALKSDLELRYRVSVSLHEFDALALSTHETFVADLPELPQVAICVVGFLGRQKECERDITAATQVIRSNYEGPASVLAVLANRFDERGNGSIVGISSAAGERGRAANYVYGSAKAGLTAFLSGLRNRLSRRGVHVLTVIPGFVATQMTEGMNLPATLTAEPREVAMAVVSAVNRKKDIVYVRPIWRVIMLVIKSIPESIFKKLNL